MAKISIEEFLAAIKEMSVLELNELVKAIENEFGVSAAAPVAVVAGAAQEEAAGPSEVSVILTAAGDSRLGVIKLVKEITGLSLGEAKAIVDSVPKAVKEKVSPEEAEAQVKAYAERLYAQQTGSYITDDIKNNSSGSFWSGVKQILTFGLGNKTTADENIAMINGTKQTTGSKASKIAGNVVGGLFGGLLAVGSFLLFKGKKA